MKISAAVGGNAVGWDLTVLVQFSSVPLGHRGRPQKPQLLQNSAAKSGRFLSSPYCQTAISSHMTFSDSDSFQCLLLMIEDVTMLSDHVCMYYGIL